MRVCFLFLLLANSLLLLAKVPVDEALKKLKAGNERFVEERQIHPRQTKERREITARGQTPFAIILGCADSRVSPELLFDQGIGDLFVVRVAGNVVGATELDSIEFAAYYLESSVILVLGHEYCGAVKAVIAGTTDEIEAIADLIAPAVVEAKKKSGDLLYHSIIANVKLSIEKLKASPILMRLIQDKKLDILGGYYDLETGRVNLFK